MSDDARFFAGSDNVYADLGFEEADLELAKANWCVRSLSDLTNGN